MRKVTNFKKDTLTADEQELLDNYRALNQYGKHEVQFIAYMHLDRMHDEYSASRQEGQNTNIIDFRTSTV